MFFICQLSVPKMCISTAFDIFYAIGAENIGFIQTKVLDKTKKSPQKVFKGIPSAGILNRCVPYGSCFLGDSCCQARQKMIYYRKRQSDWEEFDDGF